MSRAASSARLGATLRSLIVHPAEGFAGALTIADRRDQLGRRPAEGLAPFTFAAVGGASSPTSLLTYDAPVSNDVAPIGFKQSIGATEPLRTGTYGKALIFTLSTTTP